MPFKTLYPCVANTLCVLLVAGIAGCAAGPNPTLERVRTAYNQTQQDPNVRTYASAALTEAGTTLSRAERVWEEDKDGEEVEHLAYVTEQQLEITRAIAQRKAAEAEFEQLGGSREQVLLGMAQQRANQLEKELAEFKARETERGLLLTLGDVLFEVGRADLKPGLERKLIPLATFLKANPDRNVLIEGHTDNTGSDAYNQQLSQRRAEAVATLLLSQGISPLRITTRGYGEVYPVAPNTTATGRQQNRRVEIVVLHAGEAATGRLRP